MRFRVLVGVLLVTAVLLAGLAVMFAFGAPARPGSSAVSTGEVPAPDPNSPLMIEVPGCVCHSDDPALVEQHQGYRMNQCFGCHKDGMPAMGG